MPLPVRLADVVEAIEPLSAEWSAYLHRETGEIVAFSDEEATMATGDGEFMPDWFAEFAPKVRDALSSEAYVQLPEAWDFNEYEVMEAFANAQPDKIRERLLQAMRGSGAFARFKTFIRKEGLEEQWYGHRDRAIRALAIEFLDAEGIPYIE